MAKKKAPPTFAASPETGRRSGVRAASEKSTYSTSWWLTMAAVLLLTGVVFSRVFTLQFVNWDDPENLLENPHLRVFAIRWDWDAVWEIFTNDVIGNYNPLPIFTFAIEKYFFAPHPEENPFVFHFTNWALHLGCTAFTFVLFTQLGLSLPAVAIGALLFGIHPMRVESVAWVTERKDVLYAFFFLAALTTYIQYVKSATEKGGIKWYFIALTMSVFSYLAKIQAVTLPLTMITIDFFLKRPWHSARILIVEKLPWWLMSLAIGLINIYFLKNQQSFEIDPHLAVYTWIDRLAIGAYTYVVYLIKWLYPYVMSPVYPYPPQLPTIAYVCLAALPPLLIVFLTGTWKTRKVTLLFGWAFFTFNVMFLLQIVGAGQAFLADRFTYIGYVGLFFLFAKGYEYILAEYATFKNIATGAALLYLIGLATLTYRQIGVWQNGTTLWNHVKALFPHSPLAWKQAAFYYRDKERNYNKAIDNYKEAIRLDPKDAYVYNGLAKVYIDMALSVSTQKTPTQKNEWLQQSLHYYNMALYTDSIYKRLSKENRGEIWINRGVAHAALGFADRALADIGKGLSLDPKNANGYLNRGLIHFQAGRYKQASDDYESYLKINPYNANIYNDLGLSKAALGQWQEAIAHYSKAITLNNRQPVFYLNRARIYKYLGKKQEMQHDIERAKALGAALPDDLK